MSTAGSRRVLLVALIGEGGLAAVALAWIWLRGLPLVWGDPFRGTLIGLIVSGLLAAVQYGLLHHAPSVGPVRALRKLYAELLAPLFANVTATEIAVVSVLAGVGEELCFRGAMQQDWGWPVASVLFGLCHVSGRETVVLGAWAALVGGLLGWLLWASGGLVAPMVAHAAYDVLALSYIRWGRGPGTEEEGRTSR